MNTIIKNIRLPVVLFKSGDKFWLMLSVKGEDIKKYDSAEQIEAILTVKNFQKVEKK